MVKSHRYCVAFSGVIREHLRELEQFSCQHTYERNQVVYFMDDPSDELYLIDSGRVKVVRVSTEGKEKIIDIYQEGDFFGELCICGGGKRADQAIAIEPTAVTSFKIKALLKLLPKKPELSLDLLLLYCGRLTEAQDQIATLAFDNIPQRLAKEILRLSQSTDSRQENGGVRLGITLTHEELAGLVGTSREIITTVMNQFRHQGLVDYTRRNIFVFPDRVEQYLNRTRV